MIYWCPLLPTWHKFWFLPVSKTRRCRQSGGGLPLLPRGCCGGMPCDVVHHTGDLGHLGFKGKLSGWNMLKPWVLRGFFHMKYDEIWFPGVLHVFPINSGIIPSSNLSTTPQKSINAMDVSVNIAGNKTWSGLMLKNFFRPHHRYGFVWKYH